MAPILTLTLNPALDIHTSVPELIPTDKMRCSTARYDPGGGGVNVARAVVALGGTAEAIITSGSYSGAHIRTMLGKDGIAVHAVTIANPTRESFTVTEEWTGQQYKFVLPGPHLTSGEEKRCLQAVTRCASGADYLVVSGSVPPGCSDSIFAGLARIAEKYACRLIVDTAGPTLKLVSGAYLIKPSLRELRECVGNSLIDRASQVAAARDLIDAGVSEIVVISYGSNGAMVVTVEEAMDVASIHVPGGSGVGAGDNMVAAITYALDQGWSLIDAVRFGTAAGAATLLTPGTQPCRRVDVDRLLQQSPPR